MMKQLLVLLLIVTGVTLAYGVGFPQDRGVDFVEVDETSHPDVVFLEEVQGDEEQEALEALLEKAHAILPELKLKAKEMRGNGLEEDARWLSQRAEALKKAIAAVEKTRKVRRVRAIESAPRARLSARNVEIHTEDDGELSFVPRITSDRRGVKLVPHAPKAGTKGSRILALKGGEVVAMDALLPPPDAPLPPDVLITRKGDRVVTIEAPPLPPDAPLPPDIWIVKSAPPLPPRVVAELEVLGELEDLYELEDIEEIDVLLHLEELEGLEGEYELEEIEEAEELLEDLLIDEEEDLFTRAKAAARTRAVERARSGRAGARARAGATRRSDRDEGESVTGGRTIIGIGSGGGGTAARVRVSERAARARAEEREVRESRRPAPRIVREGTRPWIVRETPPKRDAGLTGKVEALQDEVKDLRAEVKALRKTVQELRNSLRTRQRAR